MNDKIKSAVRSGYRQLRSVAPATYYRIQYHRAIKKLGNTADERDRLFERFLSAHADRLCLQIGVKEGHGGKFGPNWVSVDLYDTRDFIDYHYDLHDLKFDDGEFDAAVCISVLEHVPHPETAIRELRRVLKPGGEIWVQLPFNYPYHESPKDYWRVSPDGLRVWMQEFEELRCGSFLFCRTSLVTSSFFHGRKPLAAEAAGAGQAHVEARQADDGPQLEPIPSGS